MSFMSEKKPWSPKIFIMDTPECRHQHIRTDWRKQNHAKGNTWARALGLNHTLKESQDTVSPNPNPEPLRKANK